MGIFKFFKKQFIDIIEWEDNTQNTLVYKYPMLDNEIQNGATLVVRPSQYAIFMNEGVIADIFTEGTYTLSTQNLPTLSNFKNWSYGFKSPFKSDVYFISGRNFIEQKWGTKHPVMIPDPKLDHIEIKAFGLYSFKISNPKQFLSTISSTNKVYTLDNIQEQLRGFIQLHFAEVVVKQNVTFSQLSANYSILSNSMAEIVNEKFMDLGIELTSFIIENISAQEQYEEAFRQNFSLKMDNKFCTSCGEQVTKEALFCQKCGNKLN